VLLATQGNVCGQPKNGPCGPTIVGCESPTRTRSRSRLGRVIFDTLGVRPKRFRADAAPEVAIGHGRARILEMAAASPTPPKPVKMRLDVAKQRIGRDGCEANPSGGRIGAR